MSLFAVILLLSILGILFINQLAQKSKGTIIDNYSSVDYTMKMLYNLDDMFDYQTKIFRESGFPTDTLISTDYMSSKELFEKNLQLETRNITEKNEANLVNKLQSSYKYF